MNKIKKISIFIVIIPIFVLLSLSASIAGPKVAIVKHDDHKLVGESWTYEITRLPKGDPPDRFWRPEWSKESEAAIEKMVRDAVQLAGGFPVVKGDVVAIMPNVVISPFGCVLMGRATAPLLQCATTDARVARAVALLAKEAGAKKIYFVGNPMAANGKNNMKAWGYEGVAKEVGAELVAMDAADWKYAKPAHEPLVLKEYAVPKFMVEEVTKFISVPVMKLHCLSGYTGTLKNVGIGMPTGQVYGVIRYGLPHDRLAKIIIDVCSIKKIDYSVIDAIWAMEGNGPLAGQPVPMDMVIAGADPVAVDAVMVETMGMVPEHYGTIRLGEKYKLGTYKEIQVAGRAVNEVMKQFVNVPPDKRAPGSWGEIVGWAGGVDLSLGKSYGK